MPPSKWSGTCALRPECGLDGTRSAASVLVFACGNPSRGDDALGPLLLDRLRVWLATEELSDRFELLGDFQLQIEHALDLLGRRMALFIDAGQRTPAPFLFRQVSAEDRFNASTHALSPAAVLAVLERIGESPPPAFVLCVRGECFDLGAGLSVAARAHADAAFRLLQTLCRFASYADWQARVV